MEKTSLTIDLELESGGQPDPEELKQLVTSDEWLESVANKVVSLVREKINGEAVHTDVQVQVTIQRPGGLDSAKLEDMLDALAVAIITRDDPALLSWARAQLDRRGKFGLSRLPGQDEQQVDG
jgi:hypothetical protein